MNRLSPFWRECGIPLSIFALPVMMALISDRLGICRFQQFGLLIGVPFAVVASFSERLP